MIQSDIQQIKIPCPSISHLYGPEYSAAVAALAEERGGGCNEAGVYVDADEVMLCEIGRSWAVANVIQTPKGYWLSTVDWQYRVGGGGSAPSIMHKIGYKLRQDAVRAAAFSAYRKFRALVFIYQGVNQRTIGTHDQRANGTRTSRCTGRSRAVLDTPAFVAGFDDVAVMGEAIE